MTNVRRLFDDGDGAAPGANGAGSDALLRALVLDADPASVRGLQLALDRRGVGSLAAHDGDAGIALLLEELLSLDVLLVDLDLPGWDARRLTRLIRGAGGERDLGIVVVAREAPPALRAELLSLGADAVVDRRDGPEAAALAALVARRGRREAAEHPGTGDAEEDPPANVVALNAGVRAVAPCEAWR